MFLALGVGVLGEGDGDVAIGYGAADDEVDALHFQHGLGGVGEGAVEEVSAAEVLGGDFGWDGHGERDSD